MKKRILFIVCILFVCTTGQAQFIAQMSLMTPHYYPGEIYFTDGHHESYDEVELPRVGKSKLGVKKNTSDKGYTYIEAIDIVGIKIWHKNFPDKKHVLYYVPAIKSMTHNENQWGNPIYANAWGVLFKCEMNLKRPEWDKAQLLLINGGFIPKKKAAEFFTDNATIHDGVKSGKLRGTDIIYIMDEMAGGKQAELPVLIIPETQTDSVSNGEVGDDE